MDTSISFFSEDIDFNLSEKAETTSWLLNVALAENRILGDINFIFCNDTYIHKLNVDYLKHDTLTDIITFPYESDGSITGDVFISVERVKENAQIFDVDFIEELHRVMVHGILHLCGYGDKNNKETEVMRSKENFYLSIRNRDPA